MENMVGPWFHCASGHRFRHGLPGVGRRARRPQVSSTASGALYINKLGIPPSVPPRLDPAMRKSRWAASIRAHIHNCDGIPRSSQQVRIHPYSPTILAAPTSAVASRMAKSPGLLRVVASGWLLPCQSSSSPRIPRNSRLCHRLFADCCSESNALASAPCD